VTTLSAASIWTIILVAGAGTLLLRVSFIGLARPDTTVPPFAQRALRLVPAAVLSALVAAGLFRPDGDLDFLSARLAAGIVAIIVAWRTRSVVATLIVGMVTLWILEAL
jgi:branched-subunit amino acid transport protein